MATMKATVRNGRTNNKGKVFNANHNTRTETRNLESHINHDRTALNTNIKIKANGDFEKCQSFDSKAFELEQYEIYYGEGLKAKNERYIKDGHPERCKTLAEVYQSPKTAPLETIIQLGSRDTDIDYQQRKDIMLKSALKLVDTLRQKYGDNFKILSFSLHLDETTPHIHLRSTFIAEDKFGYKVPNQSKAFAEMGIERPDTTKKEGKYNSPLITFSDELRNTFFEYCEQNGVTIDREVKAKSQKHRDILEYKCEMLEKTVAELKAERDTLKDRNSISAKIQQSFNEPDIKIEAEVIPEKKVLGKSVEPEKVKISKTDYDWLVARSKLTVGIKTAFDNLQKYGKELWDKVNREERIADLTEKIEAEKQRNRANEIEIRSLNRQLNEANTELYQQQEFMQKMGIWKRFIDFIKERIRERPEPEITHNR